MKDGEVILFRRHGEFLLGRYVAGPPGKLQVSLAPDRVVRINPHQVVLETDVFVRAEAFPAWRRECEALMLSLDLSEVWDLAEEDGNQLSLDDLSSLYWGPSIDPLRRTALQAHLSIESTHFLRRGAAFVPRSRAEVEALLWQRTQEQEAGADEAAFLAWLSDTETMDTWTHRQQEWLEGLRQFAIFGEGHASARTARRLLREIQPGASDWRRLAFDLLVQRGVFHEDEPLELYRKGIPREFSPEVLQAAEDVSIQDALSDSRRRDLMDLEVVTVDEASTVDMDDGLSLQSTPQGHLLGIHIADATALVVPGGPIDAEAARRLLSIYLPEQTIPMLPPRLSTELGSLCLGSPRLALSLLVRLDRDLAILDWELVPSLVRSRARLSYEDVDAVLAGHEAPNGPLLRTLDRVARHLRGKRQAAGALDLNRPQLKVQVDAHNEISVGAYSPTPARMLVAEFMVLANHLMAEFCRDRAIPAIYRTQEQVDITDLESISSPEVWGYQVMRRLRPSSLALEPRPQALLAVPAYLQCTSPLRRYLDLVMQRQIMRVLVDGEPCYDGETMAQLLFEAEGQLRELGRVEEDRKRHWLLKYLEPFAGGLLEGVVLDLRGREALVELRQFPFRANLYMTQPAVPGDVVTMRLQEVDLWRLAAAVTQVAAEA